MRFAVWLSLVSLAAAIAQPDQQAVAGVIHGTVVGNDGTPASGIGLTAFTGPLGGRLPSTRTDRSGNYRFERLSWASYAVYADDADAGYSIFSTGPGPGPAVTLSPEHPEAEFNFRLPPPAGFLQIHLTNRKTGRVIPGIQVTLMSVDHPDRPIFMGSSASNRPILITPDKDLLLHVTSQWFHEWRDSAGAGKPIRLASGSHLGLEVHLEPQSGTRCLEYEPTVVNVTGRLVQRVFPGPPNYENTNTGDARDVQWLVTLSTPACVYGKLASPELNTEPESGIKEVQLVIVKPTDWKRYAPFLDKNVRVTGMLFHAQTAQHHTPVLLTVQSINGRRPQSKR